MAPPDPLGLTKAVPDTQERILASLLQEKAGKAGSLSYCVVGAGNGGMAMAGHLSLMGFPVRLYNRTAARLQGVLWHGGIKVEGSLSGFGQVTATSDLEKAVEGADVLMVVTPSTAHRELARLLVPFLAEGQLIILNPGRTGGALEFRRTLDDAGLCAPVVVAETQTFLYASRSEGHTATIYRIKAAVPLATLPSHWIPAALALLKPAFPQFTAGSNVLATSLENIGAVFHPALTLLNAGWIESTGGDFEYYLAGITPSIAAILEKIDAERVAVATALGVHSHSAREWLYVSYGSSGKDLYEAIQNTTAYKGIQAPATTDHRYVSEDIPMSLVPLASLGGALGVPTPTIDMIIDLGSAMHSRDYRGSGRTVETLGLAGLSVKQIGQLVVGLD